ncbi:MAG: hypothetical protein ACRC5M_07070 [Anaeroplasmataceae bacterium]
MTKTNDFEYLKLFVCCFNCLYFNGCSGKKDDIYYQKCNKYIEDYTRRININ